MAWRGPCPVERRQREFRYMLEPAGTALPRRFSTLFLSSDMYGIYDILSFLHVTFDSCAA